MRHIYLPGIALGMFAFVFMPRPAAAAIESVTVNTSRDYEQAKGYTYAEITIAGTAARDGTISRYSVPAVIIFPRHGRGNGVGVVDWLNSAFYHFYAPTVEDRTLEFTRLATGNYLFEEGYTYLTVQWNKAVTEIFGPTVPNDGKKHNHLVYGSIERSADAWEILLDAARLLKNPRAYPGKNGPARVGTVLSSGYSQGGALQLEMLAERRDPRRIYDGHLIQMIGLACWKREDDGTQHFGFLGDCSPLPRRADHAPVMVLQTETDMVAFGPAVLGLGKSAYFTRNARNPNWRQYEIAGVSHMPEPVIPLGLGNQNSADPRPVFRAALRNLAAWARCGFRNHPPASRFLKGDVDSNDVFIPTTDDDGHMAGGVRLPHAVVPLGNHTPLNDLGRNPFDVFTLLSGTFTRFSNEELLARYPTHAGYVKRVRRAVDELAAKDYITHRDRKALIAAAEKEPLYDP